MKSASDPHNKSMSNASSSNTEISSSSTHIVRKGSYFSSDSLRFILHSAATRDLHAVQGVSRQFKKLAKEELQSRSGLIYRITGDEILSQIRICFDAKKQLALEARGKLHKLPIMLPIRDKKTDLRHGNSIFELSDNILHIRRITASNSYDTKPLQVDFLNDKPCLLLEYSPAVEAVAFRPNENEVKLINAIKTNDTPSVDFLLKAKVNPNIYDHEGVPVLILAASNGDLENVKLLVAHGANLEARSAQGAGQLTPLLTVAWNINKKPKQNEEDKALVSPHEYKQKQVMMYLIENGACITAQANTGKTILHYLSSVEMDNREEIQYLISRGVDPTQVDLYDKRPSDVFSSFSHQPLLSGNKQVLYIATIHTTPALYCSHWSRLKDGSAYYVHFNDGIWINKKYWVMDAVASKVKSIKTEDPFSVGLADDMVNFEFPNFEGFCHRGDLPIPECSRYALCVIKYEEKKNCITLCLRERYKDNEFVRRAIEKMFWN